VRVFVLCVLTETFVAESAPLRVIDRPDDVRVRVTWPSARRVVRPQQALDVEWHVDAAHWTAVRVRARA
jgi:hypothetical protein